MTYVCRLKNLWSLSLVLIAVSLPSFGHSPSFEDYYEFDDSNGGASVSSTIQLLMEGTGTTSQSTPCTNGSAAGYPCKNIDLQSFVAKSGLGGASVNLNDIWGWTDPLTGAEIAIVGLTDGTSFVDVTDSENPVFLGKLRSHNGGSDSWRDIKVYGDHAFIVADGSGNQTHGLQVFDLRTLRNVNNPPQNLSESAHLGTFGNAHNIAINEDTGYAYIVGSNQCSGGLFMVNITNPSSPSNAGCFSQDGYTHDAQCVLYQGPDSRYFGQEICFAYNEDTITIVDVSNKSFPRQISRTPYAGSQYTHQGWLLDENQSIAIMNDELDESRNGQNTTSYIFDVSNLQSPVELGRYRGPTSSIDHNLYTNDGYVFESNYRSGLRILATDNIEAGEMTEVASFDVVPFSDSPQFSGAWSSYIYFDSGNIVVSDIGGGLFVVKPDWDAIRGNDPGDPGDPGDPNRRVFYTDDLESQSGWVINSAGTDTAVRGQWQIGDPEQTTYQNSTMQPDRASSGAQGLFTGLLAGLTVGANDVDGGATSVLSPAIDVPDATSLRLSFDSFLSHVNNASSTDYFRVWIVGPSNNRLVLENTGSATNRPHRWVTTSVDLQQYANQQIRLKAEAADTGGASLIEAGIDKIVIDGVPRNGGGTGTLSVSDVNVLEGDGSATVRVMLSQVANAPVSVSAYTRLGTAVNGQDYYGKTETITFAPGDQEKAFTFSIVDDNLSEPTESLTVKLTNATGANIERATGTVTIADDDDNAGLPKLVLAPITVSEEAGSVNVRISLSESSASPVTLQLFSRPDSATPGSDYYGKTVDLTIPPGTTQRVIPFTILDNTQEEPTEIFQIIIKNVVGAVIESDRTSVRILDND